MIEPGATIGVVGGGQLGRMLALEARRMGYRVAVLDPGEHGPAAQIADIHVRGALDDIDAALELTRVSDVITLEWENTSAEMVQAMGERVPVRPGARVLEVAQHRVREKTEARRLGVGTAEFRAVRSRSELHEAIAAIGTPAILKTASGGYDGKGQVTISTSGEADAAFDALAGSGDADLILEAMVDFRLETSVICARTPGGRIATFPVVENRHVGGILDLTIAPADVAPAVITEARRIGEALVEGLDVVGVLGVELFVTGDDRVLLNEIAPRPHNSGHHTWESCSVSQFEQQLRAVCDLPLEDPVLLRPAAMANLLGEHVPSVPNVPIARALAIPETTVHLYGKAESRPGRKMGHVTSLGPNAAEAASRAVAARDALAGGGRSSGDGR